jgi:hypothetical protein
LCAISNQTSAATEQTVLEAAGQTTQQRLAVPSTARGVSRIKDATSPPTICRSWIF